MREAGKQSVTFWISVFTAIVMAVGAVNAAINVYIVAPSMHRQLGDMLDQRLEARFAERDKRRALEIEMLREDMAELKVEVRALRDKLK